MFMRRKVMASSSRLGPVGALLTLGFVLGGVATPPPGDSAAAASSRAASASLATSGYYWQVGAQSTDSTDHYATGARSFLGHFPLPQYEPSGATVFVWIASTLGNGSFYQAGTATNYPGCRDQMSEFVQAFGPAGNRKVSIDVSCGVTIPDYANFSIYVNKYVGNGFYQWNAGGRTGELPGSAFKVKASGIGRHTPFSVAELSSGNPIDRNSQLGPVGANPALQTRHGGIWYASYSAQAYYGYGATCPPTKVFAENFNTISMGTGLNHSCTNNGAILWAQ